MDKLIEYFPKYDEIKRIIKIDDISDDVFRKVYIEVSKWNTVPDENSRRTFYLLESIIDKCWEQIHIGHYTDDVPLSTRQIYALANYLKIFFLLRGTDEMTTKDVDKCRATLDEAILLGSTQHLYERSEIFQEKVTEYLDELMSSFAREDRPQLLLMASLPRLPTNTRCDIRQLDCPSVEEFRRDCFRTREPALLLNTISHWPAFTKWHDFNYIQNVAGNRTVPIEIGANYTVQNWSQQLVKMRDFLERQFFNSPTTSKEDVNPNGLEYLAQYELFDQIPALKADIRIPDYCTLSESENSEFTPSVDIKAWLGPKGTVSPLHYDPKHNILCQVVGMKHIILADANATPFLYPHGTEFLKNTSQVNAEAINIEEFPLTSRVQFLHLTLQEGDCLYIPPKWWHHVRSKTASFSVSFWWE